MQKCTKKHWKLDKNDKNSYWKRLINHKRWQIDEKKLWKVINPESGIVPKCKTSKVFNPIGIKSFRLCTWRQLSGSFSLICTNLWGGGKIKITLVSSLNSMISESYIRWSFFCLMIPSDSKSLSMASWSNFPKAYCSSVGLKLLALKTSEPSSPSP